MKFKLKFIISTALLLASASALATPGLTPAECNDYPFKPLSHEVTHAQLMRELSELESVGYNPGANDNEYPSDIQLAEQKLQAEYTRDCVATPAKETAQN